MFRNIVKIVIFVTMIFVDVYSWKGFYIYCCFSAIPKY